MKNPKVRLSRIEEVYEVQDAPQFDVNVPELAGFTQPQPIERRRVLMAGLEFIGQNVATSFVCIPFACLPEDAKIGDEFFLFVEKSLE